MSFANMSPHQILQFNWMDFTDGGIDCLTCHPGTNCATQAVIKTITVAKKCSKFYLILHLIPFIIFRLKKINDRKKLKDAIFKFIKNYIGSIFFMATLVSYNKAVLCLNSYIHKG